MAQRGLSAIVSFSISVKDLKHTQELISSSDSRLNRECWNVLMERAACTIRKVNGEVFSEFSSEPLQFASVLHPLLSNWPQQISETLPVPSLISVFRMWSRVELSLVACTDRQVIQDRDRARLHWVVGLLALLLTELTVTADRAKDNYSLWYTAQWELWWWLGNILPLHFGKYLQIHVLQIVSWTQETITRWQTTTNQTPLIPSPMLAPKNVTVLL